MSDQLLNSHWYRIADSKLSLPNHVRVDQHVYRKTTWYILRDEISGKHHRFNQAAYNFIRLIDGRRSINDIWQQLNEELGDDAPTQNEVIRLLGTLYFANFLQANNIADIQELIERRSKQRKQLFKTKYGNPLALRFSLLDPDSFLTKSLPFVAPFFTRTAAFIGLFIILFASLQMVKNWDLLTHHAAQSALSPANLFLMWLVYPVIKALHELGHGFAVKRWGGEVHEMGIMMLVMMPVPYVDASAASSFRSKYKRMLVGAAGIIIELLLASVALLIWLNIQQGMMSDILFNVMLIGGASTLLFNGNPLLKFDGYFVLADAIEIPGLAQRSNKYFGYLIQKHIFKVTGLESPVKAKGETPWFIVYGIAAFIYKLILMVAITLFVAKQYFFIGVALACWALTMQLAMPIIRWLKYLFYNPVLMQQRSRAVSFTAGFLVVAIAIIFMIPVPLNTVTQGVVWMPEKSHIRANADGFIDSVLVESGTAIAADKPLIETVDPLQKVELTLQQAKYHELKLRHDSLVTSDTVKADIAREEMILMQGKLARLEEKISDMVMASKVEGTFILPNTTELEGYFVKQGDPLAYVIDYNEVSLRGVVPQNAIGLVRQNVESVEVRFVTDIEKNYQTKILREIPAAAYKLPSKALSQQGGGKIQTDPLDKEGVTTQEQFFQFELALPEELNVFHVGQRVYIKFKHGSEPLALQWYRSLEELFLKELGKVAF